MEIAILQFIHTELEPRWSQSKCYRIYAEPEPELMLESLHGASATAEASTRARI